MGTGACGASESLANCAWAKGIYEHQGCHDSAPGALSISVNVAGESVNDCSRLAHMCNSSVEWVEDFRSDCPVTNPNANPNPNSNPNPDPDLNPRLDCPVTSSPTPTPTPAPTSTPTPSPNSNPKQVTCGACGEESQKEAEAADAARKADATRNTTEVALARTVADLALEPRPDDTVAQLRA